jgi:hypothetical protein
MYDGVKILSGLGVFLVFVTTPFWRPALTGPVRRLEPKIVTKEKECVAPRATMRERHMVILSTWRETVVREGKRVGLTESGKSVTMSLSGTCLQCHTNKAEFCDACHADLSVTPPCWDCHVVPKEVP